MSALGDAGLMGFVGVSDLDAAQRFYGDVLGLDLKDERPFALVADVGGTMLRITEVPAPAAAPYTVLGWSVPDIAAAVDELTARGVVFTRYEFMDQDERGIWTAPGGGRIAWFLDPDRNNLSLAQLSP
ncbi:putative enzyme related to lactoylglutathione lyase [Actinomycetospora succinea]|uniref:Putative enzyme related to lactoylglutathione lyase n=1 Tax=Actinomycetospora succinea TaxID=663603 RepID=A0A4R6UQF0_9PSEU|nr:VOC family protein [Actinomycetospora succinea]TDQ47939.1 putative enzyme related to lactoylglutathione lyase [Actinomycetospora succinea]